MTEKESFIMKRDQSLQLIFISVFFTWALGSPDFHLVNESRTFNEAKTFCREMYADLASVQDLSEMNKLVTLVSGKTNRAYIGLENGGVWKWHWSSPDEKVDFLNWREGEPQATNKDACAVMDPSGKWFESECGPTRSFVCQGDRVTGDHIFVAERKSWRNAQDHCRGLSTDLISIHSAEDNEAVHNISGPINVWIGLFKDPWTWSDGSNSSFRYWKPSQPNHLVGQDCAVMIENDGRWNDLRCTRRRDFVCRGAKKMIPVTTIQPTTRLSTTTKQQTNMTTPLNVSFADVSTTVHLLTTLTNQSNVTNVTSEREQTNTTVTPHIPDLVSSNSSTQLNNATSKMPNMTATMLPANTTTRVTTGSVLPPNMTIQMTTSSVLTPNTTVQVTTGRVLPPNTTVQVTTGRVLPPNTTVQATTGGVSALTTPVRTTVQTTTRPSSTTQPPTLKPPEYTHHLPPGNLILIKENMTWIEAMSYCRRHHIDLVHIPTEDVQQRVAEQAKDATSPHVWLGLRYTCYSNFWFWTSSGTSCYQNWAPGQGTEREYPCDATGAVEATGGQQWVGLSQTEKLNFICSTCSG